MREVRYTDAERRGANVKAARPIFGGEVEDRRRSRYYEK